MSFGDLLLPPSHKPGQKHPLVIVQYNIRGFLRGSTGDEYPLHLLAANGFAVLGYQRPQSVSFNTLTATMDDNHKLNVKDWADRKRAFSALESAVDAAIVTGAVDADRIGITGLSDGASTTCYALINSTRYKAAAISSGCEDPVGVTYAGPAFVSSMRSWNYPPAGEASRQFWAPISLAVSADRVSAPILALRAQCKPIEMYVFPNEFHNKWQPIHRDAVYRRTVSWFDYWLRDKRDPERSAETARWDLLRAGRVCDMNSGQKWRR